MIRVIIIYIFIAAISFFVGKYFWVRTPTDYKTISKEILSSEEKYCKGEVCEPPEGKER